MSKNGCCQECPGLATLELESPLDGGTTLNGLKGHKGSKGGSRSCRALSHRGPPRGNGLSGPLQLRLRAETRRQVPPPDRGHRPRPLDAMRAEHVESKVFPGYDRLCRAIPAEDAEARARAGQVGQVGQVEKNHVVRMKVPIEGDCVFPDLLRGEIRKDWASVDDQVILK